MKKLVIALGLLMVLPAVAMAAHQPGPNINCIAAVYDVIDPETGEFLIENVPWANADELGDHEVILVTVFHDQGSVFGPNTVRFSGSAGYAVFGGTDLLRVIFVGSGGHGGITMVVTAGYKLFHANGDQSDSVAVPPAMAALAAAGARTILAPWPFDQADEDEAKALDLGLCSPTV